MKGFKNDYLKEIQQKLKEHREMAKYLNRKNQDRWK